MKANENQKKVCKEIVSHVMRWIVADDINSQTIHSDIEDCIYASCGDFIDESDVSLMEYHLLGLLAITRRVK